MLKSRAWRFGLLAAALATAASATAQAVLQHKGAFRQSRSGAVFPQSLAGFARDSLVQYDGAGDDIGATYRRDVPEGTIALTAYVYPSVRGLPPGQRRSACASEFADAAGQISARFPGARPLGEGVAPATHGVPKDLSHSARFSLPTDQNGAPVASTSEIRLYCFTGGGDWQVKFRITAPEKADLSAVQAFIDAGPWPAPKRA